MLILLLHYLFCCVFYCESLLCVCVCCRSGHRFVLIRITFLCKTILVMIYICIFSDHVVANMPRSPPLPHLTPPHPPLFIILLLTEYWKKLFKMIKINKICFASLFFLWFLFLFYCLFFFIKWYWINHHFIDTIIRITWIFP